jgi:hypothetical protein
MDTPASGNDVQGVPELAGAQRAKNARSATRTCVYRKLKHGRSGDEVRPGWRVNESHRFAEPGEKLVHPCSKTDAF